MSCQTTPPLTAAAWRGLAALLLGAFVLRMMVGLVWQAKFGAGFPFPDSESYWTLAERIGRGESYRFNTADAQVFRTPGYPLLLAGWLSLWPGPEPPLWWGRLLSAGCGTASVGLGFWLGRRLFSPATGWAAAAILAVQPEVLGLGVYLLSEAPFAPLLLGQVAALSALVAYAQPRQRLAWAALAGLIGGLATLTRPSWLLFTPGVAVLLPLLRPTDWRSRSAAAGLMLLVLMVTMLPWWVRNYQVTGHFVPTTLQTGATLYDGVRPGSDGRSDMRFVPPIRQKLQEQWRTAGRDPSSVEFEYALDQHFRQLAWQRLTEHPGEILAAVPQKFLRLWNLWPNEPGLQNPSVRAIVALGLVPLLLGAAAAVVPLRRRWELVLLCWLPALYITGLHVIFVSSLRYRQPALLPLAVLAAAAAVWAFDNWPDRRRRA